MKSGAMFRERIGGVPVQCIAQETAASMISDVEGYAGSFLGVLTVRTLWRVKRRGNGSFGGGRWFLEAEEKN